MVTLVIPVTRVSDMMVGAVNLINKLPPPSRHTSLFMTAVTTMGSIAQQLEATKSWKSSQAWIFTTTAAAL